MFKHLTHSTLPNGYHILVAELLHCAKISGNSQQKIDSTLQIPKLCHSLAHDILNGSYIPRTYNHFVITEPKLREIYAPEFRDRIVQMWVATQLTPMMESTLIDDTYANRKNKGTLAAIYKTQKLMRSSKYAWGLQLDIYSYFNHINKRILIDKINNLIVNYRSKKRLSPLRIWCLTYLIEQILTPDIARNKNTTCGDLSLLKSIPLHKRLIHSPQGTGLPIGSVTSQIFGNFYLNDLDHYIKHTLKVKGYVRYMDDLLLLSDNPNTLKQWELHISTFLSQQLKLKLHPKKRVLTKTTYGFNYLGYNVFPHYKHIRHSTILTLKHRLKYFNYLIEPDITTKTPAPERGQWQRWEREKTTPVLSIQLLKAMLSTINKLLWFAFSC